MLAQSVLRIVLWIKILVTAFAWVAPLLLASFSPTWWSKVGVTEAPPPLFSLLLAAAFVALTIGYVQALLNLGRESVRKQVWVGIVSNGLACLVIVASDVTGAFARWIGPAALIFRGFALILFGITAGLVGAGIIAGGADPAES